MPGRSASSDEESGLVAAPQAQKTTPATTPSTLAVTMSTTRQRARGGAVVVDAGASVSEVCTVVPFPCGWARDGPSGGRPVRDLPAPA